VDISDFFTDAQTYPNKIATHLHGGLVPWISDGGPFAWFTPAGSPSSGVGGPDYPVSFVPDMGTPDPGTLTYYYPNGQSARLAWYHDHAHDITRLNAYAGIASAYLITDEAEQALIKTGVLPNQADLDPLHHLYQLGVPLIIQDKGFNSNGTLWYPDKYESPGTNQDLPSMLYSDAINCSGAAQDPLGICGTGRWSYGPADNPPANGGIKPLQTPSVVPEAFFDTILVNGAPYPYLPVQPKRYRFRILNGSQARFYNLQLYVSDGTADGITLKSTGVNDPNGNPILVPDPATNLPGPAFIQIGSEGGFLPAPVAIAQKNSLGHYINKNSNTTIGYDFTGAAATNPTFGNVNKHNLVLAPAERADITIDFRGFAGKNLILYSDTPAPFPSGDIRNDYYPGAPDLSKIGGAATPIAGNSPDTRILMQFRVANTIPPLGLDFSLTLAALKIALPLTFKATQPAPLFTGTLPYTGTVNRNLTLNEDYDNWGRLVQRLGTTLIQPLNNQGGFTYGMNLDAAPTELPNVGDKEVWQIFNLTGDTHPIHFHLVNVQIIQRAKFDPGNLLNKIAPTFTPIPGTEYPPDDNEKGWKETVRMNPGEMITVIMKFDLPKVPFTVPESPRIETFGIQKGNEYVWHCHILEHEEHDMMRPLVVVGPNPLNVVPDSIKIDGHKGGKATFKIVNGTSPYKITPSNPAFPPVPDTVGASDGTFSVQVKKGTFPRILIYTIKDSASPNPAKDTAKVIVEF
jgi:spore coat protein A